jgi:DNA-directed RNA polymerase subunit RPC12/RpoP
VKALWDVMSMADIDIAHNGDEFDIKKANARFLVHGLPPLSPYKTIDTKKVAKKYFRFDSNKLDELGHYLGLGRKLPHTGFNLWKGCMAGDKKSWKLMTEYNKQDVILLEKVYLKLLPWIQNYPIVHPENGTCRNCGSKHITKSKSRAVKNGWKQQYQCQSCGAYKTGEMIKNDKEEFRGKGLVS